MKKSFAIIAAEKILVENLTWIGYHIVQEPQSEPLAKWLTSLLKFEQNVLRELRIANRRYLPLSTVAGTSRFLL